MKFLLYDILLHLFLILLIPYFLFKMITLKKYTGGLGERFGRISRRKKDRLEGGPVVWVHAVSVGETKAVLPVIKLLKERHPDIKVLFSTITGTGQSIAGTEGMGLIDALIYYPLDLTWVVRGMVRNIRPALYVVVEKEVWPNIIRVMEEHAVPVAVVNGTISQKSFKRFRRLKFFFAEIFGKMSFFGASSEGDRKMAVEAGVRGEKAVTTGNVKFDLTPPRLDPSALESLKAAVGGAGGAGGGDAKKIIVAGSTHPGEEELVLEAFIRLKAVEPDVRLVLAPRHPERFAEAESIVKKSGLGYSKRSSGGAPVADVLILDTMGELMNVYSLGDVALVGGSLVPGIGGHNLLEPAYFARPVLYGPYLTTYLGMAEMLEAGGEVSGGGGGVRVDGADGLYKALKGLLSNDILRKKTGENARKVVESNRGAVERTVEALERLLPGKGR
jgi:3-deoxy-D-manno-octulosonic-acid transferase